MKFKNMHIDDLTFARIKDLSTINEMSMAGYLRQLIARELQKKGKARLIGLLEAFRPGEELQGIRSDMSTSDLIISDFARAMGIKSINTKPARAKIRRLLIDALSGGIQSELTLANEGETSEK